jgi:ankyrin repeat protein
MKINNYLSHFLHYQIPCIATMSLLILAWSSFAFCDEIHYAAARGKLKEVKELLKKNPELVSSRDNDGLTPLHYAVQCARKDVAELLLAKGADVNARDKHGDTPLHYAVQWAQKDAAELLLAKGADINAKGGYGMTPLRCAVGYGHKDIIELLRQHGGQE